MVGWKKSHDLVFGLLGVRLFTTICAGLSVFSNRAEFFFFFFHDVYIYKA